MRLYHPEDSGVRAAAALRWGGAGLLVVALHAGLGWWVVRHVVSAPPPDTVQGIPIDLEPVATPTTASEPGTTTAGGAAPTPQTAAAPTEPQSTPEASPAPDPTPTPSETTAAAEPPRPPQAEPQPPAPEPPTPMSEPRVPEPQPQPEEAQALPTAVTPTLAPPPVVLPRKESTSDALLAPPPPKRPTVPDPRAVAREAARRKAEAEKRAQQRAARAEAQAAARASAAQVRETGGPGPAEAAQSSASSGAAVATWRGAVQVHLRSFTPPGTGMSGTARVSFSVDRSGRVVSASLAGSSGDSGLDSAAVAMVRRASPFPAPPAELGTRVNLSVPVRFQ